MNKLRRKFEEFIKFHMNDAEINNKLETVNNGLNYANRDIDLMWISWQVSRESLINSLEPVGYAAEIDINEIEIYGQLFLNEDPTEDINVPLYRLD